MTDTEIIMEMAKIDGMKNVRYDDDLHEWRGVRQIIDERTISCDYLGSHDVVQRVINNLDSLQIAEYSEQLERSWAFPHESHWSEPRQKCEAILLAFGKMED